MKIKREFISRITDLPLDNKFLELLDSTCMTTTKSEITLATFKVRFLSVLAIRKECYLNLYFPFVINHRNGVHSYGGATPFAIRSSVQPKPSCNTLCQKRFKACTLQVTNNKLQIRLRSREYKYGHSFSNVTLVLLKITFLVHRLFWPCNSHLSFLAFVLFVLINSRKPSKLWEYKRNDAFLKSYSKSKRKKVANH